ncbi:DNA-binding protein [bacterium]|nr:DNA-binding protein [bacterium]
MSVRLLTVKEIAQTLGTHPETVRRWIRDGRLPAMAATKRTIRVRSDVVEQLLRQNQPTTTK